MAISLSGLDLGFLRKPDPKAVQPGRFMTDEAKLRQRERVQRAEAKRSEVATPYFMPDVDVAYGGAWKSIIDGSEISSRSNWVEHNRRHGVIQAVDVYGHLTPDEEIARSREIMGYDPSLVGKSEVFDWATPASLEGE